MIDLKNELKKSIEKIGQHLSDEWFLNIIKNGKNLKVGCKLNWLIN